MTSPHADSGDALYATSPRHLAGPGDPRLITQPLQAADWMNHSRADTAHFIYTSPGGGLTVALRPVPSAYTPWWHITGTHDRQPWSAEFGGNTPCEILAEFTGALLHPAPDTSADVWHLLTTAGWRYYGCEQDDETARHPSGSLALSRHTGLGASSAGSWTAEAAIHLGSYFWSAEFHGVPPHLITAFATALARSEPVQRAKGAVPDPYVVIQTPGEPHETAPLTATGRPHSVSPTRPVTRPTARRAGR
ncbi:DUF317 domain-containing protein [Streptomyces sp. DG2A-72]|uniref:DUF317 domain-containing protein n=1 Tax=Streptomyces sp. DG2A-72 TaxID=3051386 RepID=UPI00265B7AD2|nr:DUF317 domain-containing protein [Streptomyces sp. DG2A-72]MDO0936409.1 DUF317 domain-containing protein [Streptomyces sp. DG2A-72]